MCERIIGRVKTVILSHGDGVITSIIAHKKGKKSSEELTFSGSVLFDESVKEHIKDTILPIVIKIMKLLSLPSKSLDISAVNIGASSSSDLGIKIQGFSADVPIFISMLSTGLEIPIRQDIVYTGHISSSEGDISQVKNLALKAETAVNDPDIKTFVFPSLAKDLSLKILKPKEYETTTAAIRGCRGRIKICEINNISALLEKTLEPHAIASASLKAGFFDKQIKRSDGSTIKTATSFIANSNHKRFWDFLEKTFYGDKINESHNFVREYVEYHIRIKKYPSNFGKDLYRLVISLPLTIRRAANLFPLLNPKMFANLIQFINKNDHDDITPLHNAIFGEISTITHRKDSLIAQVPKLSDADKLLDFFLEKLNSRTIEREVTNIYDEARETFMPVNITIETHEEIVDTVTSFYTHVLRHTNSLKGDYKKDAVTTEALNIFKKAFPDEKNFKEALAIAKSGSKGGMSRILNIITEYLKKEAAEKYRFRIIKEVMDPLDFDTKVSIIETLMEREKSHLPKEITSQPPERYADKYIEIIKAYVDSRSQISETMRKY